jgi:plasmid stability protein
MASLTIKNIPEELYEMLKQSAHLHHRSVNSELIHCLESALMPVPLSAAQLADAAQLLRSRVSGPVLTDAEITLAKQQGRR